MNFILGFYYLHEKDDVETKREMFIRQKLILMILEININDFIKEIFIQVKNGYENLDKKSKEVN